MKTKALFVSVIFILSALFSNAQVPTKWRGPNANGIYNESGLLKSWPENGPEILWHFDELGKGFCSPVFANGNIFLSGMEETTGYIYCLSDDGKLLWKKTYGEEFSKSYPGARTSPVVVGDKLYMYTGFGVVVCMDSGNGDVLWSKEMFNDFDGENIRWGATETLAIDGDMVYCTPGGEKNNVVALNRMTGNLIWSCEGEGDVSAYCSPLLVELLNRKLVVTMTADNILGIDAVTGKLLWSHEQTNKYSIHANTPIYHDGALFCFSGYGQGGVKLKMSADGSNVSKEWFSEEFDNRMGGAVLIDGFIYGSGDKNRTWQCIDWQTGEQKYASSAIAKGNVISADGLLFCYSEKGELALAEVNSNEFKVLSQSKVELGSEQHWAHTVIDDGRLFLRHGNTLIAYKIK